MTILINVILVFNINEDNSGGFIHKWLKNNIKCNWIYLFIKKDKMPISIIQIIVLWENYY